MSKGKYFSAIWGALPHNAIDIFESLIWDDHELRDKYTTAKAAFLEDTVERIFRSGFPNAAVLRGSLWSDEENGKDYENDLAVIVDNFAIIAEAKSGGLSDPAKRGAPKSLFETLRELIEEPSEQALRFIQYLRRHRKEHQFKNKRGAVNVIDSARIDYYIPLGVTFSHLGTIGSNLKKLIAARVVEKQLEELAPSMTFTDLEDVFELLPLEIEKIHYLARRREFEAHMQYEGDELDLLGFYLDNGFNIGETEYARDTVLNMSMKSKELDPYFVGTREGKAVKKPELAMTDWWKDLLEAITSKKKNGWVETGFILLNSTKEDQAKFELALKELMERVRSGKADKAHNWIMFASGPERRRYFIAGYPYATDDRELRNRIMSEIISGGAVEKGRGAVVIGVHTGNLNYPYSVLARRASTDLFDVLTLQ